MIVRRAMKNSTVVAGGGAIDVCLSLLLYNVIFPTQWWLWHHNSYKWFYFDHLNVYRLKIWRFYECPKKFGENWVCMWARRWHWK